MFSFFKDTSGKVIVDASRWMLDQEASEISKDIRVSKDEKEIQRIQVRYRVRNDLPDDEVSDDLMKYVLGPSQHLGFLYAPAIGAGDGYLAFRITSMKSQHVMFFASVHTSDQKSHSVLMFQSEPDVKKIVKLFSTGEDIIFELLDLNTKPIIKFVVPNESGFEAACAILVG